ncbi:DUF2585 family protein [Microvirga pudoricolor]|uniref:DUF2585 family protein n=1 Tax=Microvirga pudoricolor TaxID=2778729 RepID=UPI0019510967|nr:DUF2585 family protein [Microvirga pudoricolor]MBM6596579.1 DUF2585 family protein [Microvirga pudoricolor]
MTDAALTAESRPASSRMTTGYAIAAVGVIGFTACILLAMGRVPICTCGTVEFWHGTVNDSGNSQHLTDWYTFSHVIHGFLFYGATWLVGRLRGKPLPIGLALLLALGLECAWEIVENTNMTIERYRATNIALNYYGDSVINSVSDILAMALGFWLARVWPIWLTVTAAIAMEVVAGYWIRDNLILNIIMLIHPIEAINRWQGMI